MSILQLAKLSANAHLLKQADEWRDFLQGPGATISDPFHAPAHPDWRKNLYADLANQQNEKPSRLLGAGSEAMAVQTKDNNVLKFSYKPDVTKPARAGLDIPTLATYSHEFGSAHGNPVYAVKQPLADVSSDFWKNLEGNVNLRNKAKAMGLNPVDLIFGFRQTGTINSNGVPTQVLLDRGAVLDQPRAQASLISRLLHGSREKVEDLMLAGYKRPNVLRSFGSMPLLAYLTNKYVNKEKPDAQTTAGLGLVGAAPWAIRGVDIKGIAPLPGMAKINVRGGLPAAGLAGLGSLMLILNKNRNNASETKRV